jgi:AP endonuclease 1
VSDPRTQGIPLVLETPNFDADRDVWGTEIAVLNRLSLVPASTSPDDAKETTKSSVSGDAESGAEEIRETVMRARKAADAKKAKKVTKNVGKGRVKGTGNSDKKTERMQNAEDSVETDSELSDTLSCE